MAPNHRNQIALGGEFPLSSFAKNSLALNNAHPSPGTIYFESGRDAIRALLTTFPTRQILASSYSCETVISALGCSSRNNLKLLEIDSTMYPDPQLIKEQLLSQAGDYSNSLFFLGNLWGTPYPLELISFLKSFRDGGGIVVEDITHKFDLGPMAEVDGWICSVRKWFGTSGLATLDLNHHGFNADQKNLRVAPLVSGRLILMKSLNYFPRQSILRRQIIERLRNSDAALGSSNLISLASTHEIRRFKHQDWQQIFAARIRNKIVYEQQLQQNSLIQILNPTTENLSSFPTTIKISTGNTGLRAFLRSNDIFAANLWPLGQWGIAHLGATGLSHLTLTLPSDQRFNSGSCARVADIVNQYQNTNLPSGMI